MVAKVVQTSENYCKMQAQVENKSPPHHKIEGGKLMKSYLYQPFIESVAIVQSRGTPGSEPLAAFHQTKIYAVNACFHLIQICLAIANNKYIATFLSPKSYHGKFAAKFSSSKASRQILPTASYNTISVYCI